MNKTFAFQRPLLEKKPSSQMSFMNVAGPIESKLCPVDQERAVRLFKRQWSIMTT